MRIICTDRKGGNYPIVALISLDDNEILSPYKESGMYDAYDYPHNADLFFAPQKQSRWVFMYKNCLGEIEVSCARENKSEAAVAMRNHKGFALTEITWEE